MEKSSSTYKTGYSTVIVIVVVLAILSFCACGNGTSESSVDSTSVTTDTVTSRIDTTPARVDTMIRIGREPSLVIRSAVLGYSYFSHMLQHEMRPVFAYISINNPTSFIISRVRDLNADEIPVEENDTVTISTYNLNMLIFKYVDLHLLQNDSDFIIKEVHPSSRQEVDGINGNKWQWNVTPRTSKEFTTLTLNVVAEKPNGSRETFESRNIAIDVTIDKSLNRKVWDWMMDNPGKTLTIVIIPLVAFFGKRIFGEGKKEKPKEASKKDNEEG